MTTEVPSWAGEEARALPRPLLFATVSGAHLYGFPSVDSDLDLRAAHLLPAVEVACSSSPDCSTAVTATSSSSCCRPSWSSPRRYTRS